MFNTRSLLCVPAVGPDFFSICEQLKKIEKVADCAELRLDLYTSLSFSEWKKIRKISTIPLLVSFRQQTAFSLLSALYPEFVDLDYPMFREEIPFIRKHFPETKLILSYHDFDKTPNNLEAILEEMESYQAGLYKIATLAHSPGDALRMLTFAKQANRDQSKVSGLCMGEQGEITRIFAPLAGCPMTYGCLDRTQTSAVGQIPADAMLLDYRFRELQRTSMALGLIGDPVDKSISHRTHNATLKDLALDAVYAKMCVTSTQLAEFFQNIIYFPFKGLSVTMPLKEAILPYLDSLDDCVQKIGAANTIKIEEGRLYGYNTDGIGAVAALKNVMKGELKGKRVLIVGAGGTAKAIAYEAIKQGADVCLFNRNLERAKKAAFVLQCSVDKLDNLGFAMSKGYDVLVQATSVGMTPNQDESIVPKEFLLPGSVVLDVVSHPKETRFLKEAKEQGCITVNGQEMFVQQAIAQFRIWFEKEVKFLCNI